MRMLLSTSTLACAGVMTSLVPDLAVAEFFKDSQARLQLRNYYFNDDYRDGGNDRREWAQGFILKAQSGFTESTVGFGMEALGLSGIRLDSSRTHAGTGLLPVHDDGRAASEYSSLGITAKLRWQDTLLSTGTLLPKIPVLVYNDGRLLPQTFQGTQIEYTGIDRLYAHAGHLDKLKARNSTDSVDIFPQGYSGSEGTDFDFAGLRYDLSKQLSMSTYYGELRDFYRQQFYGLVYTAPAGKGTLTTDLRYFISDDAGAGRNGAVDANMFSGLLTYRRAGHSLGFGYQKVDGSTALPYVSVSTVYSFSNASIGKFIQPGERTWMLRYDFDFASVGVPGLAFMTRYYHGSGGDYRGLDAREHETNTQLKYVIQDGVFRGVGAELRRATSRNTYASDRDNVRVYLTYEIALW
ncbi:OprD family porin [Pseudomonas sp. 10-1B]|uniref:OprD family porin n=1 Tax=Pseudomonas sp. 10-1B TaxID=1546029 RepID=UPI000688EE57|nr:OprD family porin [Pseudomonas sp. 10-1B]